MGKFSRTPSDQPPRRRAASTEERTPATQSDDEAVLFRRNRTLTGSPSSYVRATAERAGHMKSGRVQAHELTMQRRKLGGALVGSSIAAVVLLVVVLQFTAHAAISTPGVVAPVPTDMYKKSIEAYLVYRPFERIRLFTNEENLSRHVMHDAPEVAAVKVVGGGGFATSVFEVTLRKPLASWAIQNARYYVDEKGVSFSRNGYDDPAISIIDESGVPVEAGVAIASNRFLGYVGRTIGEFEDHGVAIDKVSIPIGTTRQIAIIPSGKGYPLRMSIDRAVGEQVEDGVRALRYVDSQNLTPQYIDVRVGGRAFYKE